METIKLEDSFAGAHISSVAAKAVETLATYGDQDVQVSFEFNGTMAYARKGDTADDVVSRWDTDMRAAHEAYINSDEYKERERQRAETEKREREAVMVETANTEADMRSAKVPWPKTEKQLLEYIGSLVNRHHDYGTCVYAMSMAATAAFNYVSGMLGVTGFQASCADLDILRRTRHMDGPFMIIKAEDALYPQYNIHGKLSEALTEWKPWLRDEAKKKMVNSETAHPTVRAHWEALAAGK